VLAADNEANARKMPEDYLSELGFRVVTAKNGQQADGDRIRQRTRQDSASGSSPMTVDEMLDDSDDVQGRSPGFFRD
jgi:hypothetical protein